VDAVNDRLPGCSDHADVDARWCLVHATHIDAAEIRGIVERGAVVGLCRSQSPTSATEFSPRCRTRHRAGGSVLAQTRM
jgi:cytosine/adenosine deaminase-related metal-dependent hydrolase